ncbi:DUF397 domain-containing protein [Streptomyces sp. NPDC050617]|uniref:DUF397 domain-containing protein n=1 Tax=Streptomyces sp. NPDC050617 TaxID=3154628 RepID=UPI00343D5BE8
MTTPETIEWQKSSYSGGGENNNCVEVGIAAGRVHLRESDAPAVAVTTTPLALAGLLRLVREGRQGRPSAREGFFPGI